MTGTLQLHVVGADAAELAALRRAWKPAEEAGFEQRWQEWWDRERAHRHAVVARVDGEPVGMVNGQVFSRMPAPGADQARWLYVANLFVAPTHRRRGIATALVRAMVDLARDAGMVRVVLAPSEESVPLYRGLGFRPADDLMRFDLR